MKAAERADLRRAGILLAITGALYVSGLIGRGPSLDPTTDPAGWAALVASTRNVAAALVTVVAMGVHIVGVVFAIRAVGHTNPRVSELALVISIAALVLTIAVTGPFVYTWPAIARSYLDGNARALESVSLAVGPLFVGTVLTEGALATLGGVLLARLFARAGAPTWIVWAYAISAPLYATPIPGVYAEVTGSILLLAAGVGLARTPQAAG